MRACAALLPGVDPPLSSLRVAEAVEALLPDLLQLPCSPCLAVDALLAELYLDVAAPLPGLSLAVAALIPGLSLAVAGLLPGLLPGL
jgi:hypothetical protein